MNCNSGDKAEQINNDDIVLVRVCVCVCEESLATVSLPPAPHPSQRLITCPHLPNVLTCEAFPVPWTVSTNPQGLVLKE